MTATEDRLRRTMETILDHIGDPDGVPDQRSPPRDHHRPAEAPEHQRGGDTRRRHRPGTDSAPRRHTMDRPGPARRVPRRAADLMEKRARPRSKRPPVGSGPLAARQGREGYPGRFWLMGDILSTIFSLNPSNIVYISYTYTTKYTFLSRVPLFCRQGESRKLSRSQPLGRNTEGNPPGWYPLPTHSLTSRSSRPVFRFSPQR